MDSGHIELPARFQNIKEIGRGGAAVVYVAFDTREGVPVAIKVLHRRYQSNQEILKRFQREAQLMISLRHPNLVQVYDFVLTPHGQTYIVMEYVYGWSLKDLLKLSPSLRDEICLPIIYQIATALAYAHGKEIIHRDLKPQNILISNKGLVKLSDFGIAKTLTGMEELTRTGHFVGTPLYSSPEQIAGERDLDGRSDIYSLGCIMYELYAGVPPFIHKAMEDLLDAIAYGDFKQLAQACPKLHSSICKLNERMMSVKRDKRPESMEVITEKLLKLMHLKNHEDTIQLFRQYIHHFGMPQNPEPPSGAASFRDEPTIPTQRPIAVTKRPAPQSAQTFKRPGSARSSSVVLNAPQRMKRPLVPLMVAIGIAFMAQYFLMPGKNKNTPKEQETNRSPSIPSTPEQELLKKTLQPLISGGSIDSPPWVPPVVPAPKPYLPEQDVSGPEGMSPRLPSPSSDSDLLAAVAPPAKIVAPDKERLKGARSAYGNLTLLFDMPVSIAVGEKSLGEPRSEYKEVPHFSSTAKIKIAVPGVPGTMTQEIKLNRDKTSVLKVELTKDYLGTLVINAPSGVRVFVDGRFVGDSGTFRPLSLWKGLHDIQFVHQGYGPRWKKVDILPGQSSTVSAN